MHVAGVVLKFEKSKLVTGETRKKSESDITKYPHPIPDIEVKEVKRTVLSGPNVKTQ